MVYRRFAASKPFHGPLSAEPMGGIPMPPYPWYHNLNRPSPGSRVTVPYTVTLPSQG